MIDLREYQVQALDAAEQAHREGVQRPLIVHPTGTGKGVEMAEIVRRRRHLGRAAVLVHRGELADQFIEKLGWIAPELKPGVVKADRNEVNSDVVVASVQTAHREARLKQLGSFATVVVDEAHHAPASTWTRVLTGLGCFSPVGPLTVGFTATPIRDGKSMGVWEKVVHYYSIRQAIHDEYLVPILPAEVVETKMDLDSVRKSKGDYSDGSLGEAMEASGAIEQIADAYVEHAGDRKGVAFTPTVKTAHALAKALLDRGIPAAALDGGTLPETRKAILAGLKSGSIQVVTNCGVLTEGFDEPTISCVVVARPTTFQGLYVQMVGRGTRLAPGKKDLLIIDVVGATKRHELITQVDLGLGTDEKAVKNETGEGLKCPTCDTTECENPTEHRCRLCHRYLPASRVKVGRHENCQSVKAEKVDVFGARRMRWLPLPGGAYCLGAGPEVVVMAPAGEEACQLASYDAGRLSVLHRQLPVDWAMGIGEDRAKAFGSLVERDARWLAYPPTDQQRSRLVREGLPADKVPLIRTRGDAADLMTRISGRRALKKMGVTL